jgi:hypothetical protein
MKRLFPTSLALLLVTASLGHALGAVFCPRGLGRECCFAKTHQHISPGIHENLAMHGMHMDGMSMDGMNVDDTRMYAVAMDHVAMNDMAIDGATSDMFSTFTPATFGKKGVANKFDQPVESCAHCLSHSDIVNAPVSFVRVADRSGKEIRSVLLPVSRFLIRPAIPLAQIGLPGEHAPPHSSAARHILISIFLI